MRIYSSFISRYPNPYRMTITRVLRDLQEKSNIRESRPPTRLNQLIVHHWG